MQAIFCSILFMTLRSITPPLFYPSIAAARKDDILSEKPYRTFRQRLNIANETQSNDFNNLMQYDSAVKPSQSLMNRSRPSNKPTRKPRMKRYDAVIIGAGWAGIKAAQTLLDQGITNILVLEANDYIGGRSKTVNADGSINVPNPSDVSHAPIDMGSEWLYTETSMEEHLKNNGYLNDVELKDGEATFQPMRDALFYLQSMKDDGTLEAKMMGKKVLDYLYDTVWGGFLSFRKELLRKEGDQSYFTAAEKYKKEFKHFRPVQYINLVLSMASVEYTGRSDELSLYEHAVFDQDWSGQHYVSIPPIGFGNTAATFAKPFSSKIKLGAKVKEINYKNSNKATVFFTSNGLTETVTAKTVLVTVSLGVLKAGAINFSPRLPDWKQDAIDNMGFGVVNKCAMQWNDDNAVAWPEDKWIQLVTPDDASSGKWTTFFNPTKEKGIPTLVGWIGGQEAIDIEAQTDKEILVDVMRNLKAMFPAITQPDRVIITRWGQEPNVLGTYSFKKVGRDFSDDTWYLRENVDQILWFAGEATTSSGYGTAHGAWKTGEYAALEMEEELRRR